MTDRELAERFGWWWREPAKALRGAFPDKSSEEAIRKWAWPELERAAFNYELASRSTRNVKYLLGERFDRLTQTQMDKLVRLWPRQPRPLEPIRFLPYAEEPDVTRTLRQIASEDSLILSASDVCDDRLLTQRALKRAQRTDFRLLKKRALKRAQRTETVERKYAQLSKGWSVPQYFTMNLAECGNTAIVEAFRKHVAFERERLKIPAPKRNKGRANRRAAGLSFRKVEALDVWNQLPSEEARRTKYDAAEARSARGEATKLSGEIKSAHLLSGN